MIALPAAILNDLASLPMSAWESLAIIARYLAKGGSTDPNNARIRAEALAAHALLHAPFPSIPKPAAIATQPKAT